MHLLDLADLLQLLGIVVALQAGAVLHLAVALHRVDVAALAVDAALDVQRVVVHVVAEFDISLRIVVARQAEFLGYGPGAVDPVAEVAEEARHLRHRHVVALHDLRVAAGAAQLNAAHRFAVVPGVVKLDPALEFDRSAKQALVVAAAAQAALILDLGVELRVIGPGPVGHHLVQGIELALDLVAQPGGVVALDATDVVVARGLPRHEERLHHVARHAELRLVGVLQHAEGAAPEQEHHCQQRHFPVLADPRSHFNSSAALSDIPRIFA